ncbi:tRNA pseudouridine(55) synthase TruB [Gehongia tenuis]|uniref:tRNA pseudouridine synthase B n=1 Tax=Gehongia tenuis TaxID=2763655 RepID=A0A926D4D3_9FIRM|nr:tRNA pseudouridine(55) synthase TruB [Gehongia tenuis]MBC8531117.1 tRNA pseudouridine(55) synthase TruB [Gehongia tenuis]
MNGVLNVHKPLGMTSSDVVVFVRRAWHFKKVGHGGTLDPEAEGVLPILVGRGTRLFDAMMDMDKEYLCEITLGVVTDTQDSTGQVLERRPVRAEREALETALEAFHGPIEQVPPMYSAIKMQGKKLYELARSGQTVERKARNVEIYGLQVISDKGEGRFDLWVRCSKGTYIRTLCHDIGEALGCGAHMSALKRLRSGPFCLEQSVSLETIQNAAEDPDSLLIPMDKVLEHWPRVHVREEYHKKLVNGNTLPPEAALEAVPEEPFLVYGPEGLVGIGKRDEAYFRIKTMLI